MSKTLTTPRDPASTRLSPEDVMDIHRMHMDDTPWDTITDKYGLQRMHLKRILSGERHRALHPELHPEHYTNGSEPVEATYTREQIDNASRVAYKAFMKALTE